MPKITKNMPKISGNFWQNLENMNDWLSQWLSNMNPKDASASKNDHFRPNTFALSFIDVKAKCVVSSVQLWWQKNLGKTNLILAPQGLQSKWLPMEKFQYLMFHIIFFCGVIMMNLSSSAIISLWFAKTSFMVSPCFSFWISRPVELSSWLVFSGNLERIVVTSLSW